MKYGPSSASAAGKSRRMGRLIKDDGRTVIVAIDHAAYLGTGPTPDALEAIAAARPDGIIATWHIAREHTETFVGTGMILRVDGGISEMNRDPSGDALDLLYRVEHAITMAADAVIALAFPGAADEDRSLRRLAGLCSECDAVGVPVVAEMIPGGWAQAVPWSTENVARSARLGAELGADIVKTVCPSPPEEFSAVVEACPVPVVALGGPKMASDDDVVALARAVTAAGGAGIAFGRNVWGSADPRSLVERLHEVVHGGRG